MKCSLRTLLFALCLTVLLSGTALAQGQTFPLEELDAEITVPEGDFYILYPGMDQDDPALKTLGLTAGQIDQILGESHIYLDVMSYDASYELIVQMQTGEDYETVFDYTLLSLEDWDRLCREIKTELAGQGITIQQIEWYEGESVLFLYMEGTKDDSGEWLCQYQSVHNGKLLALNAGFPYLDEQTQEIKDQLKEMADSLRYTYDAPIPQEVQDFYEGKGQGIDWLKVAGKGAIGGIAGALGAGIYTLLSRRRKGQ